MPMARKPADPPGGVSRCRNRGRRGISIRGRRTSERRTSWRLDRGRRCAWYGRLVIFQHGLRLVRAVVTGENARFTLQ